MTLYLNTNKPLENYTRLVNTENFVDKSMIIEKTNKLINTTNNYLCITRPRRFGKSSVIDMLGAYYSKSFDSSFIFDNLKISEVHSYKNNLNKYNVVNISFNEITDNMKTYEEYINNIVNEIKKEVISKFNIEDVNENDSLKRVFQKSIKRSTICVILLYDRSFTN